MHETVYFMLKVKCPGPQSNDVYQTNFMILYMFFINVLLIIQLKKCISNSPY
jgi:hypothetical protein